MLKTFVQHVQSKKLFAPKHKLLLAISGGVDSVVLAHLLKMGDYQFEMAHCNFKLRAKDSELDEKFCKDLAQSLHVPFHVKSFDVKNYCLEHKVNTQITARNLRYEWFEELLQKNSLDLILTAHHANDSIETIFINLIRGTGLNGLRGIPERNGNIIRPMLEFTRDEIEEFAKSEKIKFRLDKSNLDHSYERNRIRLEIIPRLKELNPNLENTFIKNIKRLSEEAALLHGLLLQKKAELLSLKNELCYINKAGIMNELYHTSILHYLLKPYGFNESQQANIYENIATKALVGKNFYSATHHLTIDRKDLIIQKLSSKAPSEIQIHALGDLVNKAGMHVIRVKKFGIAKKNEIYLNINKIVFPLLIRQKQQGDKFKPFGMKGFKLVSDYLKDEKINQIEKQNCKVLLNGNGEIIWLVGFRSDERYRIKQSDSNLIKLSYDAVK